MMNFALKGSVFEARVITTQYVLSAFSIENVEFSLRNSMMIVY